MTLQQSSHRLPFKPAGTAGFQLTHFYFDGTLVSESGRALTPAPGTEQADSTTPTRNMDPWIPTRIPTTPRRGSHAGAEAERCE